jgi:hypothetical protein
MKAKQAWNVLDPRICPAATYTLMIVEIEDHFAFVRVDVGKKDYVRYLSEPKVDGVEMYSKMHIRHLERMGCVVIEDETVKNLHKLS